MVHADPFQLFPKQVETVELWQYTAPGKENVKIANLTVIIKRTTEADTPNPDYASRVTARRMHIKTNTLPTLFVLDPDKLLSHIVRTATGRTFMIDNVSRGDDMDVGFTQFVTVTMKPYGRDSL